MEKATRNELYLVGEIGDSGRIVLTYWNFLKQDWQTFEARRTTPGNFVTGSGKVGTFRETPLTKEECKVIRTTAPTGAAAKYPWRDCASSRKLAETLNKQVAAGTITKEQARNILMENFPLTTAVKPEDGDPFAALA